MARQRNNTNPGTDRRNYYRIDDEVFLEYRVIQKKQVQEFLAGMHSNIPTQSMISEINELSRKANSQLKSIKRTHPIIARYLSTLDEKISLIAQNVSSMDGTGNGRPNWRVNIGAGGLAFYSQLQIQPETLLAISLKIFPSHREILTYGPVIYCRFEPDVEPSAPYRVGVTFSYMREPDREALISHILSKQFAAVRAKRKSITT